MVGLPNVSHCPFGFLLADLGRNISSSENGRKMCDSLGLEYLKTIDVYHGCRCYGVTFKHKDGWSVTSVIPPAYL